MERAANLNGHEYIIGISESNDASTSLSSQPDHSNLDGTFGQDNPSINTATPVSQLALFSQNVSTSSNSSLTRTNNHHRRNRSPLNSGLWITVELVANVSQIIAAIIVLSLSRHEHPRTPLSVWIIGYTAGCVTTLPHLCWRYLYLRAQRPEQDPAHSNQGATGNNHPESSVYADRVVTRNPLEENGHNPSFELEQTHVTTSPRYLKVTILISVT